jgi:HEAT repeat protein
MKQRSMILAALAMIPFAVSVAQQAPPTPPVSPKPATPVAVPAQGQRPLMPMTPLTPLPDEAIYIDREAIRRAVEDAKWQGQWAAEEGRRAAEEARRAMEDAHFDMKDFHFSMPDVKVSMPDFKFDFQTPKFSGQNFVTSIPSEGKFYYPNRVEMPPPSFGAQGDPADSMYQVGREMLSRQDYSRAAAKLGEMIAKYPNSRNYTSAAYWQAFALFRVGTLESLRSALKVLETNQQRFDYDYNRSYRSDAPVLEAKVLRALADRNESGADAKLRDLVAKYPKVSCDEDKISIQSQVLNSLYQTDPDAAMPYMKQYLDTRDACTAELRRSAIYLLANRGTEANTNLIVQLAKNDTVRSVRARAVEVLSRMPGDAAIVALQQFMTDPDDQISSAAVRSLMRSDNPKARAAMRALIDRRESPERQRLDAIRSFDRDNTSPDDAAYLRTLFNRQNESDRVKEAVISALGQVPNDENMKFLLDVAKNPNESSSTRSSALRSVTRRQNLSTDDLIKLYDATDNRSMRNSLVDALAQRPEPAAIDKLLNIVKYSTDIEVRTNAIRELLNKNDKTITQKVLDLIGK